ncbi:MAG: gliding motility-associated C-terminal domain-containing protein [Lewinellaceae bacterium]|nr:gliding motility-associated C-terminal domain-containing protein [Lewinellaceae bacterium]
MKQLALTLGLVLSLGWALCGQVAPPSFLCVTNDTLIWETPGNNCGAFNAYIVYASQQLNGPYSVLATITDPNQGRYFHQNAGMSTWYYYLESDYNCPGEPVLQSDTLDNRIPEPGLLETVSVNGADVEVSWTPSPSPEVVAYIISRNVPGQGTTILDTVYSGNFFLDSQASPGQRSETYFLEAIDACGNKSLVAAPHNTILLSTEASGPCDRSISLSWNLYQNWPGGIANHEIWVSRDGGSPERAATIDGNATSYLFQNADEGVEYCFTVKALQRDADVSAASNEVCLSVDVVQAVRTLVATNATVTDGGGVRLDWLWNANAEITDVSVLRSDNNSNFEVVNSSAPQQPLMEDNTYTDGQGNPETGVLYYQVRTRDACGEEVSSNVVGTIFLRATAQSGVNALRWTPYLNALGTVQDYSLYRLESGGTPVLVNTFSPNTLQGTDEVNLADPNQIRACYYVEARALVATNDTIEVEAVSRSNTACAEQEAKIFIPNAFSPNEDGRNDAFLPYLQFGSPSDYLMVIYDRWGNQLFSSKDISDGWDGKSKGTRVPVGLYVYYIRIEQANGTVIERNGEISLLR